MKKQLKNNSFSGNNPQSDAGSARSLFHIWVLLFRSRRPSVCPVLSDSSFSSLFLLFLHTDAASPSSLFLRPSAALSLQSERKLRRIRSRVSVSCFENKKVSAVKPNGQMFAYYMGGEILLLEGTRPHITE